MVKKIIGKLINKFALKKLGMHVDTNVQNIDLKQTDSQNSVLTIQVSISVKNDELLALVDRIK